MLNDYLKSDEYEEMICKSVDFNEEYKAIEKEFYTSLKKHKLDREACSIIENLSTEMMYTARDLAYKKGVQDGIKLIMQCIMSGKDGEFNA